ncbi:WbqC family protein [Actinocrinis puniceicyclus]|uniref:WbqC family protein n=1 Tax=Actinocrinis puniceicyclus TaxID=977794 RepID=A0A8J7WVZ6_9ACTN|nr:WbqC family protein [Actinocrinis puniceicyclus]MBS2966139.1 WbqC family protein [Actinocrinis puniceicyclus]
MTGSARVITCHQPTYLPWAGLFHKLALADCFVVMDASEFTSRNWINRNRIKGPHGCFWLTVPVSRADCASRRLVDTAVQAAPPSDAASWQRRHWRSLESAYAHAPYWSRYAGMFEDLYLGRTWTRLAELNVVLLRRLAEVLGIEAEFVLASEVGWQGRKSRLVLDHCRRTAGSVYVSGINGRDYLIESEFRDAGISVVYQNYRGPAYPQLWGEFVPDLSVVDLLFNVGPESGPLLLSGNATRAALNEALGAGTAPAVVEMPTGPELVVRPHRGE